MSTYNAKNYTEQGGEVTHIGGSIVFDEGGTVSGFPYSAATASKLGAVKIGSGLDVTSAGVVSVKAATAAGIGGVKQAANQAASTAADVAGVVADLNTLIASLKTAGIMVADADE